jgi:hypothetical protein
MTLWVVPAFWENVIIFSVASSAVAVSGFDAVAPESI